MARRSIALSVRLLAGAAALAPACALAAEQPLPTKETIQEEIAQTKRLLADEEFVAGDREAAKRLYEEAGASAAAVRTTTPTPASLELLLAEIEYRKLLLNTNASFWGFELGVRPINPVGAYVDFKTSHAALRSEIAALRNLLDEKPSNLDTSIGAVRSQEDQQVGVLQSNAAETLLRDTERRRALLTSRLEAIRSRQKKIALERGPWLDQMDRAAASMNSALLSGISAYAGIPPQAMSLLKPGAELKLDQVLGAAASAYAGSTLGEEFTGPLREMADAARTAAEAYVEVKAAARTVEDAKRLVRAVQDGNLGHALEVGSALFDRLPPEAQSELLTAVRSNETARTALLLAREGSQVRQTVAEALAGLPALREGAARTLAQYIDENAPDFDSRYGRALFALGRQAEDAAAEVATLSSIGRAWPTSLLAEAIGDRAVAVARAMGSSCEAHIPCREWLEQALKSGKFAENSAVVTDQFGLVTIANRESGEIVAEFEIEALTDRLAEQPLEARVTHIVDDIKRLRQAVASSETAFGAVLSSLSNASFDGKIVPLVTALDPQVQDSLFRNVASGPDNAIAQSLAHLALGQELASRTSLSAAASLAPIAVSGRGGTTGPDAQDLLMAAALQAAGPYGMAIATTMAVVKSFNEMSEASEELKALDKEDRALSAETVHLFEVARGVERDEALADIENRVAKARVAAARERADIYRDALRRAGSASTARMQEANERLPLTFYHAEILRSRLARLEQALGFWAGDVGTDQKVIASVVQADPSLMRLALDPQIKLYTWLEGGLPPRADLSKLSLHWNRIAAITDSVCEGQRLKCSDSTAEMGQVVASRPIPLSELAGRMEPQDCGADGGGRRCLSFFLTPTALWGATDTGVAQLGGLRLLSVAGYLHDPGTAPRPPYDVRLMHSGLGFVLSQGVPRREQLEPSQWVSLRDFTSAPVQGTLDDLKKRWRGPSGYHALDPVEGYPLFGLYQVQLPSAPPARPQDLWVQFFYQIPFRPFAAKPVEDYKLVCRSDDREVTLASTELPLLLSRDAQGNLKTPNLDAAVAGCALVPETGK